MTVGKSRVEYGANVNNKNDVNNKKERIELDCMYGP